MQQIMINRGDAVVVRSLFDEWLERRALSGVVDGRDFLVVWVCTEAEWQEGETTGQNPKGVPWPAEHVRLPEHITA